MRTRFLLPGLLAIAAACSDSVAPAARAPAAVVVAAPKVTVGVGDTLRLEASVVDRDGGVLRAPTISWRTLDAKLTVDGATGRIVALDTGAARVVASAGELADTAVVTVTRRVASIQFVAASDSVFIGTSALVRAVARDRRGDVIEGAGVLWTTSDANVASVRDTGVVTGIGEGDVTLRASAGAVTAERVVRSRYRELRLGFTPATFDLGNGFGCALDAGGRAHCWGLTSNGRLGGVVPTASALGIAPVSGDQRFTQLEVDANTACGITADARLFCWGARAVPFNADVPTEVLAGTPMRRVTVGSENALCALATDGVVRCWGFNDRYQVGVVPMGNVREPTALNTSARFTDVSLGFHDACALDAAGAPWCWGGFVPPYDTTGALPRRIDGAPSLVQVTPVGQNSACGLTAAEAGGETWCWGHGIPGRAGFSAPVRIANVPPLRQLVGSYPGACGLTADGEAWCWSWYSWATSTSRPFGTVPARWAAPYRFRQVDLVGPGETICGITTDGRVLCSGPVPLP